MSRRDPLQTVAGAVAAVLANHLAGELPPGTRVDQEPGTRHTIVSLGGGERFRITVAREP